MQYIDCSSNGVSGDGVALVMVDAVVMALATVGILKWWLLVSLNLST